MNLVNEMIKGLLPEEEKKKVVAVYGGGFKPPTSGHFEVAKQALKENPEIDEFIIYIGGKERNGISPDESILIWDIYKQYLPYKVEVKYTSVPPIKSIYNYAKEHPNEEVLFIIGAREGNEDDFKDIASRTTSLDKYPNLNLRTIVTTGGVSGTAARNASKISLEKFKRFVPSELSDEEVEQVFNIVADKIQENDPEDGKAAPYGSGYKKLNENASYSQHIDVIEKIAQLTNHMIDKGMNIEPLPSMEFIDGDSENAKDFFGKTAYYDPNKQHIVLYTEGRHPKDIVRSYAHEMIHHIQNLEDRLGNISGTNTTEDDHLDKLEQEANLKGTMTFRNWTDSLNEGNISEIGDGSSKSFEWEEDPNPSTVYDHEVSFTTDLGTKYEVYIDVYDDINFDSDETYKMLDIAFGVESQAANQITNKGELFSVMATIINITKHYLKKLKADGIIYNPSKKSEEGYADNQRNKLYKAYIQKTFPNAKIIEDNKEIIVLLDNKPLNEAVVGDKIECDNCDWSWDISSGGDDLYTCHKCWHDNTPINEKKNKDPFGLNAYARELGQLNEGRYDKSANQFSKIAFEAFKDIHDRGDKEGTFEFSVGPFEEDIYSDQFEFDFEGYVEITDNEYNVDGGANQGFDKKGDEITPLLNLNFKIPKNPTTNPSWENISFDIKDVVRHELEHLTQGGLNLKGGAWDEDPKLRRPSKQMADDQLIRDLIDADMLPKSQYYKLEKEVDAMLQGLYFKAKKSKRPFKNVISDYLDIFVKQKTISLNDKEDILDLWRSRGKALSLPIFENQKQNMDYKIYSDMDGVLVDFEKGYEKLTGIDLKGEYRPDGENFWKPIEQAGVGYWAGLEWMSDGKQLWSYLKPFNPVLLSAPSRSQSSRIGKHVWVKHKIPGTKLILRYASQKQELATPESILIDDRQANIDQWEAAGGIGILHTSTANTIQQLQKLGL